MALFINEEYIEKDVLSIYESMIIQESAKNLVEKFKNIDLPEKVKKTLKDIDTYTKKEVLTKDNAKSLLTSIISLSVSIPAIIVVTPELFAIGNCAYILGPITASFIACTSVLIANGLTNFVFDSGEKIVKNLNKAKQSTNDEKVKNELDKSINKIENHMKQIKK